MALGRLTASEKGVEVLNKAGGAAERGAAVGGGGGLLLFSAPGRRMDINSIKMCIPTDVAGGSGERRSGITFQTACLSR